MLDVVLGLFLNLMLVLAWVGLAVSVLTLRYGYDDAVIHPVVIGILSLTYLFVLGLDVHVSNGQLDGFVGDLLGLSLAAALCLLVVILLAVSAWYKRELRYVAHTVWADFEAKSVDLQLGAQAANVIDQFNWVVGVYTSNSKCLFHSREINDHVKQMIYAEEYNKAFKVMAEHVEVLLLDKITDVYRENFKVLSSFGSVADNCSMLSVRVGESDLIEKLFLEKSSALKSLCFRGSVYHESDVANVIEVDSKVENITRIAEQLSRLYQYKVSQGFEPSYRYSSV